MPTIQARVVHAMTIPFTVQLVGPEHPVSPEHHDSSEHPVTASTALIDTVMPRVAEFLDHVDRAFSPFRDDSLVGRARRGDWSALLSSREFADVYALCQQAKRLTGGAFDPMHAGVYDPTGIVKGWAVQRAFERFLQPLIDDGRCDAAAIGGGGDIQTGVSRNSDFTWRIGVENPFHSTTPNLEGDAPTLRTITVRNAGIATSGTAKRGEHITRNDYGLAQATVVDDRLTFADMWATAAISAGEQRFRELAERSGGHITAVLVGVDGRLTRIP